MIRYKHYTSLKNHISNLVKGLAELEDHLSDDLKEDIFGEYSKEALSKLERRKIKLEKHEMEYKKATEKFNQDYEQLRRVWKKDVTKLKRSIDNGDKLSLLGLHFIKR
ncbi:MAG TPA: hypothetical protein ACFCUD_00565 [Cyclobacteriaceae bacterium]